MKITDVDVVGQYIPYAEQFPVSYGTDRQTEHAFVRLQTDENYTGYGEGTALPWFTGEVTSGMVETIERWISPKIEGKSIDRAFQILTDFTDEFPGGPGATSAVELALLDLQGKYRGIPVSELLGPRIRDTVPLVYVLPALDPDQARKRAASGADNGFCHFKVKADGDIENDVSRIEAVLDGIPEDATLRVDANTGWKNFPTAKQAINALQDISQIEYFEQPVAADNSEDMRKLWDEFGTPVFADESVHNMSDLSYLGEGSLVAGTHLKLAKSGSLRTLRELATLARHYGLKVSTVSAFGTSLEAVANLHLSATVKLLSSGCELCMPLIANDPGTPVVPFEPEVAIPEGPGLGVTLPDTIFE